MIGNVDILRCPNSHSDLHWLCRSKIEEFNERIHLGSLRQCDGTLIERPLTAALASAGGEFVYRVDDGIFFLLTGRAIANANTTATSGCDLAPETKAVRRFYEEFGWGQSEAGFFADALKFEDLRPVSRDYIRKCHLRLAKHLPSRGTYLLDAACGPIQYPEYLTYSLEYDFRICVDVSEVGLRHAQKRLGEKGIYLLCDITHLPLRDGIVDGFVSLHTIYHLPAQQQPNAIAELYRVLKQNGSGVVVYSWGDRSPLMRVATIVGHPLRALARMIGAARPLRWENPNPATRYLRKRHRVRGVLAPREPSLFAYFHDFAWYRHNVEHRYRTSLVSWRSVSVPFLREFVHERAVGQPLLTLLYWLESRFPRWFGRYGQYPVFVFTK